MGTRIKIELGRRSINIMFVDAKVNLKIFPKKFYVNARKEYELLQELSIQGINVPKPKMLMDVESSAILVREYIEGDFFRDAIYRYPPEKIKKFLLDLIINLRKIEDLNIFIPEFSTLYKNVIISDEKPYILDLERAQYSGRPIIPQLLGMLIRLCSNKKVKEKLAKILHIDKLKDAAQRYKKTRNIKIVLELFKNTDQNVG